MRSKVEIEAGICGFKTAVTAASEDGQYVAIEISSDCEKIRDLGQELQKTGPVDSYDEINPLGRNIVMETVRSQLKGCCAGCAVPAGIFKGMQVAAGLALPKEVVIRIALG